MYVLIFLAHYCYYNICIIRPVKTIDYRNFKMSTIIIINGSFLKAELEMQLYFYTQQMNKTK